MKDPVLQKSEEIQANRRKFFVKIIVRKTNKAKRRTRGKISLAGNANQKTLLELQQEIEKTMKEIEQKKTKIEELTKFTIEELTKIQAMNQKAQKLQKENSDEEKRNKEQRLKAKSLNEKNNNGLELRYELTNMKMIQKILDLSTALDEEAHLQKKEPKKQKKRIQHPRNQEAGAEKPEENQKRKILIIEDDVITTKIISHVLGQNDFEVGSSQDAEEGLKKVLKERPDLILLDIMLPGMDGYQLLTRLKANKETSHVPVIILSSLAGERDVIKGLEKGASDYILKPFSPQILFFKIKKTLALKNGHFTDHHHL